MKDTQEKRRMVTKVNFHTEKKVEINSHWPNMVTKVDFHTGKKVEVNSHWPNINQNGNKCGLPHKKKSRNKQPLAKYGNKVDFHTGKNVEVNSH